MLLSLVLDVHVSWFKGSREYEHTCGRPLGIRVGPNGTLFVSDAYLGLFEVNPVTGKERESTYSALKSHNSFKGITHSKIQILSLVIHLHVLSKPVCVFFFFPNGMQLEQSRHLHTSHPTIVHSVHICLSPKKQNKNNALSLFGC